jgi:hypothetical protein
MQIFTSVSRPRGRCTRGRCTRRRCTRGRCTRRRCAGRRCTRGRCTMRRCTRGRCTMRRCTRGRCTSLCSTPVENRVYKRVKNRNKHPKDCTQHNMSCNVVSTHVVDSDIFCYDVIYTSFIHIIHAILHQGGWGIWVIDRIITELSAVN